MIGRKGDRVKNRGKELTLCKFTVQGGSSSLFWDRFAFFAYMCMGKEASFAVFGTFQREFGTFVCEIRVCMPWVEIVEI